MAVLVSFLLCSHRTISMKKHTFTSLMFTIVLLLSSAAAVRHCGDCGRNPVPYPLSTAPDCGDPLYKLRCTAGTLWFEALGGSSYMIKFINPATQRIIIRPPTLTRNSCVSSDFHSEGVHLNETLPFNITNSNTVLLFNCTNALHLPAPMNCSENSLCHSYIKDHADAAACKRVKLCCTFRTGGSYAEYVSRVHNGGCAAYQSFVDLDVTVPPPAKKWPEPGVELQWVLPHEPICKGPMDCKELLNSKCLADPASAGQQRCFCDSGFKWDPINGLCQDVKCAKHGKGKGCKVRKKKTMLIAAVAASLGAIVSIAILVWILFNKKHNQLNKQEQKNAMKRREQILSAKASDKSDVYSFGVVLLELLTCEKAIDFNREEEDVNLVVYAKKVMSQERLMDIVDPLLKEGASNLALGTMKSLGYLAAACLNEQRQNRPSMKEVSDEIEYLISIVSHEISKT
ncbi:hypothetical protein L6164_003409 [Bauhinia variegata]|uniref:Uncharacterized protein n=1 Tax=Bauhinia variegata TaxID=167791 RepID=A0ACB9Q1E0_BAUVA|nr:hypothetical protein L6164_003409 [Bauhinia variegata]